MEVSFLNNSHALGQQQNISDLFHQRLTPVISRVLDQYIRRNVACKIDCLYVDLGVIKPANWEEALAEQLSLQIENALSGQHENKEHSILLQTRKDAVWENFLYYLEKGYFPWWYSEKTKNTANETRVLSEKTEDNWEDLKILIRHNANALNRLIAHSASKNLQLIVKKLEEEAKHEQVILWLEIEQISSSMALDQKQYYFIKLLCLIHQEIYIPLGHWWEIIKEKSSLSITRLIAIVKTKKQKTLPNEIPYPVLEEIQFFLEKGNSGFPETRKVLKTPEEQHLKSLDSNQLIFRNAQQAIIYVQNSGLVILHPFLPAFFKKLGLLKKGLFKNKQAQHKAVMLLQYLVFGEKEIKEHELMLNKIFCGLKVDESVNTDIKLRKNERIESDKLLQATIQYWSILKDTSIEGLREAFLSRVGKLTQKENNWILNIETSGKDMLLQKLPWSLSIIKFSWTHYSLLIKWI